MGLPSVPMTVACSGVLNVALIVVCCGVPSVAVTVCGKGLVGSNSAKGEKEFVLPHTTFVVVFTEVVMLTHDPLT